LRAFEFFGGVPAILVPDNLHSAVDRAHRYEPDLNRTYSDLAAHYGGAIIPARSRKPRDKAYATDCTSLAVSGDESSRAAVTRWRFRYAF
jgi:transposase